jgi:hypothetical protein
VALASRDDAIQDGYEDLSVVRVDPRFDPRWERFVAAHPQGTIYHHPAWLEVLTIEYARPSLCLACLDADGHYAGVLPLVQTRGLPFAAGGRTGRRLASLPRTPMAGPLTRDDRAAAALLTAAVGRVARQPGTQLELRLASPSCEGVVAGLAGARWRSNYRLNLPQKPVQLRFGDSRNNARIKWALGKAARQGIVVRPAQTLEDLRRWYPLYLRTMQSHAAPTRSFRFFRAAWDRLRPGLMRLLLAERVVGGRHELMAGSVFLMFARTVFYAFNGCGDEGRALRANDAIQWHAITEAHRAGFRCYDLGEVVESQDGLHDFKRKWGAQDYPLYRYYYPAAHRAEAAAAEPLGILGGLARAAWRRLSPGTAAQLSDWLYAYR